MSNHFQNGIQLDKVSLEVGNLPEGQTFNSLNINEQRLIYVSALQKQIRALQGSKYALLCMGRVTLYDSYELANLARKQLVHFDSQIFLPPGSETPHVDDKNVVYECLPSN